MKKLLLLCLAVLIFYVPDAWAGAVNPISGVGARAKAMGGTGAAVAEGASMFYYNPALLAGSDDVVETGMDYISASISYTDPTGAMHNSDAGEYFVPLVGATGNIGDFKAGVALVTPNMFGSDFKQELDMYSKLGLANVTPAVAYKLTDHLSVGASASVGYGMVDMTQPYTVSGVNFGALDTEARGFGYSYQVGALYEPTDWLSIGSSYQSKTRVELEGTTTLGTAAGEMEDDFSSVFYFPGRFHFGVGVKPTEKLLLAADATYMDYASTDKADLDYDQWTDVTLALNWESHWVYGIGAEYSASKNLKLRSGLNYQEQAIPDSTLNPVTPDTDGGLSASLGLGLKKGNLGIDVAYAHAWGMERDVPLSNAGAGQYSASVDVISAAASYRW